MTEFSKRLRYTFGTQLRYVGTTTCSDSTGADIDVLVQFDQLSDTHIRHVWNIISQLRSSWNIVLDCRIRSSEDIKTVPLIEAYLLSRFLRDSHGRNPFEVTTGSLPGELEIACRRRIIQQEQRILSLLPRLVNEPSRVREVAQAVFDAVRAFLILQGHPEVNKREACSALNRLFPAFSEIEQIHQAYLNSSLVVDVPMFVADTLALVKHLAHRAQALPVEDAVLLVNIPSTVMPHPLDDRVGYDANMPLGLVCVASHLQHHGLRVRVLDAYARNLSAAGVVDDIVRGGRLPRVVGLNSASPNIDVVFTIAKYLKRASDDIRIVCGGAHATLATDHTLSCPHIDFAVAGEGELAFLALTRQCLAKAESGAVIPGVYQRDTSGAIVGLVNPNAFPLEELVVPQFGLLPLDECYFSKRRRLYVHTTRGCAFRCTYCSVHKFWGGGVREIPMRIILNHLEAILAEHQPHEIQMVDDDFSHRRGRRIIEFCDQVHARGLAFRWKCQVRADQLAINTVAKMRTAGCFEVDIGVESGNPEIQRQIKKGLRLTDTRDLVTALSAHQIESKAFFILGFPGETHSQLQDSINYSLELKTAGLTDVAFFPAMPFPGTELAKVAKEQTGHDVIQGAVMDRTIPHGRSFASRRLRKYSAMPEVSVNALYDSAQLRILAKFAYDRFENGQRVRDLRAEFASYLEAEEEIVYGS